MQGLLADAGLEAVVASAYDCAVAPEGWPDLLRRLAGVFRCGFADVFARTEDRSRWRGLAHGLDADDYQDVFLGTWVKRNVWGARRPVERAGEVVSTREMVAPEELRRTEMYNDYLAPRGLHEGMRMSLWAGEGWVQDISLLRPWSAGPFEAAEQDVARALLPHLQRAAAVARRLGAAAGPVAWAALEGLDALRHAAFVLDGGGRPLWMNREAEALAAEADGLLVGSAGLGAADPAQSGRLGDLIAAAAGTGRALPAGGRVTLSRPSGRAPLALLVVPVRPESGWAALDGPAVLVLASRGAQAAAPNAARDASPGAAPAGYVARYGLTGAEADLAAHLVAGRSLAEAARLRGRSVNTMRTQLANLMAKTGAPRQGALVRLLLLPDHAGAGDALPRFG